MNNVVEFATVRSPLYLSCLHIIGLNNPLEWQVMKTFKSTYVYEDIIADPHLVAMNRISKELIIVNFIAGAYLGQPSVADTQKLILDANIVLLHYHKRTNKILSVAPCLIYDDGKKYGLGIIQDVDDNLFRDSSLPKKLN